MRAPFNFFLMFSLLAVSFLISVFQTWVHDVHSKYALWNYHGQFECNFSCSYCCCRWLRWRWWEAMIVECEALIACRKQIAISVRSKYMPITTRLCKTENSCTGSLRHHSDTPPPEPATAHRFFRFASYTELRDKRVYTLPLHRRWHEHVYAVISPKNGSETSNKQTQKHAKIIIINTAAVIKYKLT